MKTNSKENDTNKIQIKDGIINIYKEKGYTSHDVVAILRKILRTKKIGHTGTLDPDAEGVLPICIGKATKVADFITEKTKEYKATMKLGITTDTQDSSGKIIEEKEVLVNDELILEVIKSFVGEYNQIPPMYSALKVNGKKLYEIAREGKEIERKARKINIINIYDISINNNREISFVVLCSKGTYIRTLCNDIGEKLGCGAHMTSLIRTASGNFKLENSYKLDMIKELANNGEIENIIISIDSMFLSYGEITIKKEYNKPLYNGNKLKKEYVKQSDTLIDGNKYRLYDEEKNFIGLYEYILEKDEPIKPIKVFIV